MDYLGKLLTMGFRYPTFLPGFSKPQRRPYVTSAPADLAALEAHCFTYVVQATKRGKGCYWEPTWGTDVP